MSIFYCLYNDADKPRPDSFWQKSRKNIHHWRQKNPLYALHLNKNESKQLQQIPTDPWPGNISYGKNICDGKFMLGYEFTTIQQLWFDKTLSKSALAELHSFEWLRHLQSMSDNMARRVARQLIRHWIEHNYHWHLFSWSPDILGCRIANWIALYDFFCASADEEFRKAFYKSLWRQIKHLKNNWQQAKPGPQRFLALYGLILSSICLDFEPNNRQYYLDTFLEQLRQQLLDDGGHTYRSPLLQLYILRLLIDLRTLLRTIGVTIPREIQTAIAKMAPLVRLFRHSDGGLACFGPYQKINSNLIDMVLSLADVRGRPPAQAPLMGYERCASKKGVILVNILPNTTFSPMPKMNEQGTGLFNFEWSIAKQRILTSADIILQPLSGDYLQAVATTSKSVTTQQEQHPKGNLFTGSYRQNIEGKSFHHERSLYLDNDDFDFRGADTLMTDTDNLFALRFVLHPEIMITDNKNNKKIFLECPGGQRWQFLASNFSQIQIEKSEESGFAPIILLLGELSAKKITKIRWAFTALDS